MSGAIGGFDSGGAGEGFEIVSEPLGGGESDVLTCGCDMVEAVFGVVVAG